MMTFSLIGEHHLFISPIDIAHTVGKDGKEKSYIFEEHFPGHTVDEEGEHLVDKLDHENTLFRKSAGNRLQKIIEQYLEVQSFLHNERGLKNDDLNPGNILHDESGNINLLIPRGLRKLSLRETGRMKINL